MIRGFLFLVLFFSMAQAEGAETFIRKNYHVQHGTGLVHKMNRSSVSMMDEIRPLVSLPASYDWRNMGGVTPVKDQGSTGDCWAFASTAGFESAVLIRDKKTVSLSEQYLNDCNPNGYNGSLGGDFPILDFMVNPGQALESDYPFAGQDQSCNTSAPVWGHLASWTYIGGAESAKPSADQIKSALLQYGPVVVDVAVDDSFQAYGGGVLNTCGSADINHMVLIVGYDDAGGYWIVKNSWGKGWGESGFLRIQYGCDQIGETAAYVVY